MNAHDEQIISDATQRAIAPGRPTAPEATVTGRQITLYIKPADADIWSRARALADGDNASISTIVADALHAHVPAVERQREQAKETAEQMEVFTLEGEDTSTKQFRRVRFTGVLAAEWGGASIYVTRKGQVIVYSEPRAGRTT